MTTIKQLKVLVSAFAYSPVQGTEFAIGWDHVRAIAVRHRVWVLARSNEKKETEQYLQEHPDAARNIAVRYVPFTAIEFNFPFWELTFYRHYQKWQRDALELARELDAEVNFDLVQQVTATGFREPGYLWMLGKPFVWGPLGGMQYFPVALLNAVPFRSRPFFLLKNASTFFAMRYGMRPRAAARKAAAILAGTSETAQRVGRIWGRDALVMNEVHSPEGFDPPSRRAPDQVFRIIWTGRFQPRKALNIVLLALEKLKDASFNWELICLGSGELEPLWKKLAAECEIADRCRFLGNLPRAQALKEMMSGHCFAQPSLYDATSTVVVEALALGLPVACLNHCGFRDVVEPDYGVRIPVGSLEQIVRDFAAAFQMLAENEDVRYSMATAAQAASARYTWKAKAVRLNELYERLFPNLEPAGDLLGKVTMDSPNSDSGNSQERTVSVV
jgi:glycosyltransferase involved in cell wall biosynthesis